MVDSIRDLPDAWWTRLNHRSELNPCLHGDGLYGASVQFRVQGQMNLLLASSRIAMQSFAEAASSKEKYKQNGARKNFKKIGFRLYWLIGVLAL